MLNLFRGSFAPRYRPAVVFSVFLSTMGTVTSHSVTELHKSSKPVEVVKSVDEWQRTLSPQQFNVLREKGTERPWSSPYNKLSKDSNGVFKCAGCGAELFRTDEKFDSGSGWPSFWAASSSDAVSVHSDVSHGMVRDEVTCAKCGGHLGHVFNDGPRDKTGLRYCINGVALKYEDNKQPKL